MALKAVSYNINCVSVKDNVFSGAKLLPWGIHPLALPHGCEMAATPSTITSRLQAGGKETWEGN